MTQVLQRRQATQELKITRGSGNVFADLGFDDREATELQRKSELMVKIEEFIERNQLTQKRAADALGVSQPRISDLVNARLSRFSLDELVRMYEATGATVQIKLVPNPVRERTLLGAIFGVDLQAPAGAHKTGQSMHKRVASRAGRFAETSSSGHGAKAMNRRKG